MANGNGTRADAPPRAAPFQFTLRTMFVAIAIVAVFCGGLFAPYAWARFLTLALWVFTVPVVLLVMVVYARGYMRTFAIGGLVTTLPLLFCHIVLGYYVVLMALDWANGDWSDFPHMNAAYESRFGPGVFCAGYTAVIFFFGFLATGVRSMVESPQRTRADQAAADALQSSGSFDVTDAAQKPEDCIA